MKKKETIFSELVRILNDNIGETLNINSISDQLIEKGLMIRMENGNPYSVALKGYKSKLKSAGHIDYKCRSTEIKVLKKIPKNKKISDFY